MSNSESITKRRIVYVRFLWNVLAGMTIFFILEGLFHFPFSSKPLLSDEFNFGGAIGLAFIYSIGQESYSVLKKICLFLLIVILALIGQSSLMFLIGSFTVSFEKWLMLSLIGTGLSVFLFYRYDKKINLIPR
uniref:hypothetical protein n=1 Tax=Streptococcus pluranimalium TaxID=82348 RepID=UPI003F68D348